MLSTYRYWKQGEFLLLRFVWGLRKLALMPLCLMLNKGINLVSQSITFRRYLSDWLIWL